MSADNWAICPRCLGVDPKKRKVLKDSYGKIPMEQYLELLEDNKEDDREKSTLREDYEIGIWDNNFMVEYRATCIVCGFTYKYNYKEVINVQPDA